MRCEIKLFVMDMDGTLTDGKLYIGRDGEIMKVFSVKDGAGIMKLHDARVVPAIITGRKSQIAANRAKELRITALFQGVADKVGMLQALLQQHEAAVSQIAYIGDDDNDLPCMRWIQENGGTIGCPADAIQEVRFMADFVSAQKGGEGAVREFIEWLLSPKP